jgi:hypothetical protein
MDAYVEQVAGYSADVVWPTAAVASIQFATIMPVVRRTVLQRWRALDICGKYMPSGSDGRVDLRVAKVVCW